MNGLHRTFIIAGAVLIFIGAGIFFFQKLNIPAGRLPGDIIVKKENFSFYFPITTSLIISVLISAILYFFRK
jgi:hypothetical protein